MINLLDYEPQWTDDSTMLLRVDYDKNNILCVELWTDKNNYLHIDIIDKKTGDFVKEATYYDLKKIGLNKTKIKNYLLSDIRR